MKRHLLFALALLLGGSTLAQVNTSATVSYVLGLGLNANCTTGRSGKTFNSETDGFMAMKYTPNNTTLTNASWAGTGCYPKFPSFASQPSSGQSVQIYGSSIAYNPAN